MSEADLESERRFDEVEALRAKLAAAEAEVEKTKSMYSVLQQQFKDVRGELLDTLGKTVEERNKAESELSALREDKANTRQSLLAIMETVLGIADKCKNCQGSGRDHDGEGWLDVTCPECQWAYDLTHELGMLCKLDASKPTPESIDAARKDKA